MLNLLRFTFRTEEMDRNGILLDIPEDTDLASVETSLHTVLRPYFLSADLVLLRFPPWEMREPEPRRSEREGIARISSRFPNSSVRIISSYNYEHVIGENLSSTYDDRYAFEREATSFIEELRHKELDNMMKQSNALLAAGDNYVFHLPSGALSKYFVRAGNIQTGKHNLDTLFFWLLPYLADVDGILVDTWSIGSIALNCSRLIGRYDTTRRRSVRVEISTSYVDRRADTKASVIDLAERVSHGWRSPFLSLFSVAMTGRSINNLRSALRSEGCSLDLMRFLVLFGRKSSSIVFDGRAVAELCSLELEERAEDQQEERTSIEIDRTTFFPVFIKERQVSLLKLLAQRNRSFFERYESSSGIQIHRNSIVDGQFYRHHGIYVDVHKLLKTKCFSDRLVDILSNVKKVPRLIIVPPHHAGRALARTIEKYFEQASTEQPRVVVHLDLSHPTFGNLNTGDRLDMDGIHRELRSLKETDSIMVLDDVVTTGTRLLAYQKRLRDVEYRGEIDYVIGVQRMQSRAEFKALSSTLKQNNLGASHRVVCVDSVILPNWDQENCPLCLEEKFLSRLLDDSSCKLSVWTMERLADLRNSANTGVTDGVFCATPNSPPLRLTINSFFSRENAPQAVVLSSVAAAIQELRTYERPEGRLDSRGFPVRSVFKVEDLYRYSDGILRASILRSLSAEELRQTSQEGRERLVKLGEALFDSEEEDEKSTRLELALAIGLEKLPGDFASEATRKKLRDLKLYDSVVFMEKRGT